MNIRDKQSENTMEKRDFEDEISVVIVSDENHSADYSWEDEVGIVKAFEQQNGVNIIEILLIDSEIYRDTFPTERFSQFLNLRVIFSHESTSAALKNVGIKQAKGSLIAMFEADSHPQPQCLYALCEALTQNPEAGGCSARTIYPNFDQSRLRRCLTFLGRGQLQVQRYKDAISADAALVRASMAKSFPFSDIESPMVAAAERNSRLREAGYKFIYAPDAISVHKFEGMHFEVEYRLQKGFQKMGQSPIKSVRRIPRIMARSFLTMWQSISKSNDEQLYPRDRYLAYSLCFVLPFLEIRGMLDFLRGKSNSGKRFI